MQRNLSTLFCFKPWGFISFLKSTIKNKETKIPGERLWLTFPHPSSFPPPLSGPLLVKVYSSVQGQLFSNLKITHNLLSTAYKAARLQRSSHLGKNLKKLLRRFTEKIQKHLESRRQVHRLNKVNEKEVLKTQMFSRFSGWWNRLVLQQEDYWYSY